MTTLLDKTINANNRIGIIFVSTVFKILIAINFIFYLINALNLNTITFQVSTWIISSLIIFYQYKKYLKFSKKLFSKVIAFIIFIVIVQWYSKTDFSPDTVSIYRNAQQQISMGWNFILDPFAETFHATSNSIFSWDYPAYVSGAMKLPYSFRNVFYSHLGENTIVLTNSILIICLWITVLSLRSLNKPVWKYNRVVTFILLTGPIVWNQLFTFYVDIYLAIFSTIAIFCLIELKEIQKKTSEAREVYQLLIYSLVLMINTKLNGIISAIFIVIFGSILVSKEIFSLKANFPKIAEKMFLTIGISTFIFQLTYNLTVFNSLFFPFRLGIGQGLQGSAVIGGAFPPIDYFRSNLGIPAINEANALFPNYLNRNLSEILDLVKQGLIEIGAVDSRISGFGFAFGLVIILLILIVAHFKREKFKDKNKILLILALQFLIIFIPGSYWARLVPFQYPLIMSVIILIISNSGYRDIRGSKARYLLNGVVIILIFNSVAALFVSQIRLQNEYEKYQRYLRNIKSIDTTKYEIMVNSNNYDLPNLLKQNSISFESIPNLRKRYSFIECNQEKSLYYFLETAVCIREKEN